MASTCQICVEGHPCLLAISILNPKENSRENYENKLQILFSGNREKEGIPLVKWEKIAKPKEMGG
jgi:hypothetical protein